MCLNVKKSPVSGDFFLGEIRKRLRVLDGPVKVDP